MEHIIQIKQSDYDKVKNYIVKQRSKGDIESFDSLSESAQPRYLREIEHYILYNQLTKTHGQDKAREIIQPIFSPAPQIYDLIALKMFGKRYKALCAGDCSRRKTVEDFEATNDLQTVANYVKDVEIVKDTYTIEVIND